MTTKTIRYAIEAGNVSATSTELDQLAAATAEAIAAAFPGAEVTCPIERTSGVRPAGYTQIRGYDDTDLDSMRERLDEIAGQAWEDWYRSTELTEATR